MGRAMGLFHETVLAGQAIDLNVDQEHRSLVDLWRIPSGCTTRPTGT